MKLSEKLIMLRKEKGWSQEDFAEKLDVSRQAVSRWENETALPDAQNILRISKLFNVTVDYLLNDDCEDGTAVSVSEVATVEEKPLKRKKKPTGWYLILIFCIILITVTAAVFYKVLVTGMNYLYADKSHIHYGLTHVIENKIEATCTVEGSYDDVFYCEECGEEVLREHISTGMPTHQFYNQKCIICGEDQRERN